MKRLIKCSFDISLKNWPVLLAFNMLYKMFSYSVLYSVTSDVLELILKTAGVSYLSAENFSLILLKPFSVFLKRWHSLFTAKTGGSSAAFPFCSC